MPEAVYIHIPFCPYKCHYCDFNSYVVNNYYVMEYLNALAKEMEITVDKYPAKTIKSIFVGGGTPTVLSPKEMEFFFNSIHKHFPNWDKEIEFTMEANPGTVELEKLKVMKEYGVNRISMGVQAFQDELLSYIGRIHNVSDVYQSINNIRKAGFSNLNIDLMIGLPKQTLTMLEQSLKRALELDLNHFSVYSLKVEENTLFHKLYKKDKLPLPPEDEELQMFLSVIGQMEKHGYKQYEISNFARPGYESKHNINYWENQSYYGLGAGAHGYINNIRYENIKGIKGYNEKLLKDNSLPVFDMYEVSIDEKKEDMLMLGLRMLKGVEYSKYRNIFNEKLRNKFGKQIEKLINAGLLSEDQLGISLTKQGVIYGNEVFAEFISLK